MIPFLVAMAEAMPAVVKFVDTIQEKEKTASKAAAVAADPAAPQNVKQAAANVATAAIDDKANAEKAALKATTGKQAAPSTGSGAGIYVGIGIALFLLSRRGR